MGCRRKTRPLTTWGVAGAGPWPPARDGNPDPRQSPAPPASYGGPPSLLASGPSSQGWIALPRGSASRPRLLRFHPRPHPAGTGRARYPGRAAATLAFAERRWSGRNHGDLVAEGKHRDKKRVVSITRIQHSHLSCNSSPLPFCKKIRLTF